MKMTLRKIKIIIKKFCQIHGIDRQAGVEISAAGWPSQLLGATMTACLPLLGSALLEKGTIRRPPRLPGTPP